MGMAFSFDNANVKSATIIGNFPEGTFMPGIYPLQYTNPKEELLASRETAWFHTCLTGEGAFDVFGPDAIRMLNENCVNRDFSKMRIGGSRHAVMLDENGWLAGSSVLVRIAEDRFRFYSLYSLFPVIMSGAYDVQMMPLNRFIFQVDGPKSLQIIESAFKADFHDLKFAQNKYVDVDGDEIFVHRLGMSGALAYEIQGDESAADKVFDLVVEAGKEFGMKTLGIRQYMCGGVHTPGGYPNHLVHCAAPGYFAPASMGGMGLRPAGSAKDDLDNYYVDLYDIKWDYLVDWNHDFPGKAALEKRAAEPHRTAVTLIWDREDVGRVFAAGIYDPDLRGEGIDDYNEILPSIDRIHVDKVMTGDEQVGVSQGRCIDYYTNQFVSLGFVAEEHAVEGTELEVLWGEPGGSQYRVKATVAPMPLYNGEWRNETCDVMNMVPERPYLAE